MVETMALIEDIVGVATTKKLELLVCSGGVTPKIDGVKLPVISGLRILALKYPVEVVVDEVDPSISKGGVASPNVGEGGGGG